MIIKAQDGKGIININNTDTISIKEHSKSIEIYAFNGGIDTKASLGCYSNMEKARKVLGMICEQYQYCQECKCGYNDGINKPEFVFQMPLDREV